ncbi:MAG: subclass B1 metallo-beta-lactamase [Bacteroidota bacterium]
MNLTVFSFLLSMASLVLCCTPASHDTSKQSAYESKSLKILPISPRAYLHVSYIMYRGIPIGCNGLIYQNEDGVVVFDTPVEDSVSHELIDWVEDSLGSKVVAVVPGHFHRDCLGGLAAFHERGANSYGNELTCVLAKKEGSVIPQSSFPGKLTLLDGEVEVWYPGEGHTADNIVGYLPGEKVLFGGCLVKALKADKGFTGDANQQQWSTSVAQLKVRYPLAEIIIPGHGEIGNQALLDYTISLFPPDQQ